MTDSTSPPRSNRLRYALAAAGLLVLGATVGAGATFTASAIAHGGDRSGAKAHFFKRSFNHRIERRLERAFEHVDASDEQRVEAREIIETLGDEMKPLHESLHGKRAELRDALLGETVDATAIEVLREGTLATADELSREVTEAMVAVANVLDAEQRAELASYMSERGERRSGHGGRGGHGEDRRERAAE